MYSSDTMALLSAHAGAWTDDLLSRLDPHGGVATTIEQQLRAYLDLTKCRGTRLLDFGCGVGASSVALARLLPHTEIIGVELNTAQIAIANRLREEHGFANLRFLASPAPDRLPAGLGRVDFIMLSAVYEHLLPHERRVMLPRVWRVLKQGGILFINQTPHRWFPQEHHTTGLWGLNYLPAVAAHALAQRFGKLPAGGDWPTYLRAGIRGGTERSILRELGPSAHLLQPREGDRADCWFRHLSPQHHTLKRALAHVFRATDACFGIIPATHVSVAVQKH